MEVFKIIGSGDFDVKLKHEVDQELVELVYKALNPTSVKLTELSLKYDKDPEEVLERYNEIRNKLLD